MASDKDRADILRTRWRAGLHELNGDDGGAELCRSVADVMESFHRAKDAAAPLKLRMKRGEAVANAKRLGIEVDADAVEAAGGTATPDEYYNSVEWLNYKMAHGQVIQVRRFWRGVREMLGGGWITTAAINDFEEPSDEELLAAAGGDD